MTHGIVSESWQQQAANPLDPDYHRILSEGQITAAQIGSSTGGRINRIVGTLRHEKTRYAVAVMDDYFVFLEDLGTDMPDEIFIDFVIRNRKFASMGNYRKLLHFPDTRTRIFYWTAKQKLLPRNGLVDAIDCMKSATVPPVLNTETNIDHATFIAQLEAIMSLTAIGRLHSSKQLIINSTGAYCFTQGDALRHFLAYHQPTGSRPSLSGANEVDMIRSSFNLPFPDPDQMSAHEKLAIHAFAAPLVDAFYEEARRNPEIAAEERKARQQLALA